MENKGKLILNLDANNLSLSNAGDKNILNNDISDRKINNEESFCEIPADQKDTFPTLSVSFMELPGPKHAPHPESSPITYFELFFTSALLNLIVAETNRYADQLLNALELSPCSRSKSWRRTLVQEIRAFIAVILNMGLLRKPTIFFILEQNRSFVNSVVWKNVF